MGREKIKQILALRVPPAFKKQILQEAEKREETLTEFVFKLIGTGWDIIVKQNKTVDAVLSVTPKGEVKGQEGSEEGEPENPVSLSKEEKANPEKEVEHPKERDAQKELPGGDQPLTRINVVTRIREYWSEEKRKWVED